MRILVAEDDLDLRESLAEGLELEGYVVDTAARGDEADLMLFDVEYDLVVLDLNLPGMDGMEVLRRLRSCNKQTNVLILSARGELQDKVDGLDEGANDYMTKPFHFAELLARVRGLLCRRTVQESRVLLFGALSMDTTSREVFVSGRPLALTAKETALLEYLLLHPGQVVDQARLIEHVWGENTDEFSNSVRVHVSRLRRKLRAAMGYDPIHTRIGAGYYLEEKK